MEKETYQSIVGSIMFLMCATRPDLSFAVGVLARGGANPTEVDKKMACRVLGYIKRTRSVGLKYRKGANLELMGFADADRGGDLSDRKSISGVVLTLGGSPISWSSRKQKCVAQSSCEAEYIALSEAVKDVIWTRRLCKGIGIPVKGSTRIGQDNQSAIALAGGQTSETKTRHVDIRYHFVKDETAKGVVRPVYVSTAVMPADLMTKSLSRDVHWKLCGLLNVEDSAEANAKP